MTNLTNQVGLRLHEAAEAILAAAGKEPGSYSTEDYLAAVGRASTELEDARLSPTNEASIAAEVTDVLLGMGFTEPDESTISKLYERARELIGEQGLARTGYTGTDLTAALRIAMRELPPKELGKVAESLGLQGDPRTSDPACAEELLAEAVSDGRILASMVPAYRTILKADPAGAMTIIGCALRAAPEDSTIFASKEMRTEAAKFVGTWSGARPDAAGLAFHVEAERRLRDEGKVDQTGDLSYNDADYLRVLGRIQLERELEADAAEAAEADRRAEA